MTKFLKLSTKVYSFFERNQLILAPYIRAKGQVPIGSELEEIKLADPEKIKPWPVGTGPAVTAWLDKRNLPESEV